MLLLAPRLGHKGRCLRSRLLLLLARRPGRIRHELWDRLPLVLLMGGLGSSLACGRRLLLVLLVGGLGSSLARGCRLLLVLAQRLWHKGCGAGGACRDEGSSAAGGGPFPCSTGHRVYDGA